MSKNTHKPFHCSDVRNMDTKAFINFFRDNVMQSLSGSNSSSGQGWRLLCGTKGKVQGRDFVPPATQNYLNALHTANLLLQKRTRAYELVI